MDKQLISVLGPIAPADMGITDAHNHLWISAQENQVEGAPVLDHEGDILTELQSFRSAGGGGQIDCQPGGSGRNGNHLRTLAEKSGIHIIACTGFHLKRYYPAGYKTWSLNAAEAASYFMAEIEEGLEETRDSEKVVYPGFIKLAVRDTVAESPLELIEAAAQASIESGYALEMHTERGSGVEDFINLFLEFGVQLDRLVICHIDKRPDFGLHRELAQAGCLLEYDTFFRPKYRPEENLWPLIQNMVEAELGHMVAVATDLADSSLWKSMGNGPGLEALITIIKKRLEEEGYDDLTVSELIGNNIVRRLAVKTKE
jgi:phosphotriesterase-related protein